MDAMMGKPLQDRADVPQGFGWLVLGMHRSGTSALSRVLDLCGADIGPRLVEGSAGNDGGHWEDAVAVELHERLLADLGARWDEPFALAEGWREAPAARNAVDAIARYIRDERDPHRLWAVKDPRLCLFAPLWRAAAARPLPVILSTRHPLEVAQSLVVRDGMSMGRALALWLECTVTAATFAVEQDHVVVAYADLVDDWRAVIERVRQLPGGERLAFDQAAMVDRFIDRGRRHQRATDDAGLPSIVLDVWKGLEVAVGRGRLDPEAVAAWSRDLKHLADLVQPMYGEWRVRERALWDRVARAEHALAGDAAALRDVPADVAELRSRIDEQHRDIVAVLSQDLVRMQEQVSEAERRAASAESGSAQARELVPMLGQLSALVEASRDALVDTLSDDVRRQQAVVADALASAASKASFPKSPDCRTWSRRPARTSSGRSVKICSDSRPRSSPRIARSRLRKVPPPLRKVPPPLRRVSPPRACSHCKHGSRASSSRCIAKAKPGARPSAEWLRPSSRRDGSASKRRNSR
jgi:hypothetical protein